MDKDSCGVLGVLEQLWEGMRLRVGSDEDAVFLLHRSSLRAEFDSCDKAQGFDNKITVLRFFFFGIVGHTGRPDYVFFFPDFLGFYFGAGLSAFRPYPQSARHEPNGWKKKITDDQETTVWWMD